MRFSKVSIRKNVQIRPYEHQHVEVEVVIEEGEELIPALDKAEKAVNQALGLDITEEDYNAAKELIDRVERRS